MFRVGVGVRVRVKVGVRVGARVGVRVGVRFRVGVRCRVGVRFRVGVKFRAGVRDRVIVRIMVGFAVAAAVEQSDGRWRELAADEKGARSVAADAGLLHQASHLTSACLVCYRPLTGATHGLLGSGLGVYFFRHRTSCSPRPSGLPPFSVQRLIDGSAMILAA